MTPTLSDDPNAFFNYSWQQILNWNEIYDFTNDFSVIELLQLFNWTNVTLNTADIISDNGLNSTDVGLFIPANVFNEGQYYVFVATVTYCAYSECTSTSVL